MSQIAAIVVGAGQAGLAASYELKARGIKHVVLERDRIGEAWRRRWDSFCLVTPNWTVNLPGFSYDGDDPNGFMARDEVVDYLTRYAASFNAPVRENTNVEAIRRLPDGRFEIEAGGELWVCCSLILATGAYQRPHRPVAAATLPADILRIDVSDYAHPGELPAGDVLVVGNGQSGCQIAHELVKAGRNVVLACGRAPWIPRRIGDRDLTHWIVAAGVAETLVSEIPPEARLAANAIATGHDGGYDLNLRVLRKAGVTLTGRFLGAENGRIRFADDLAESVAWSDAAQENFRAGMAKLAIAKGWPAPIFPGVAAFDPAQPTELDVSGVGAVIFATGYRPEFTNWLPWKDAFDDQGFPLQQDGTSTVIPGLHFLGLHLLRKRKSSLLAGVGEDASIVADAVARSQADERGDPRRRTAADKTDETDRTPSQQ